MTELRRNDSTTSSTSSTSHRISPPSSDTCGNPNSALPEEQTSQSGNVTQHGISYFSIPIAPAKNPNSVYSPQRSPRVLSMPRTNSQAPESLILPPSGSLHSGGMGTAVPWPRTPPTAVREATILVESTVEEVKTAALPNVVPLKTRSQVEQGSGARPRNNSSPPNPLNMSLPLPTGVSAMSDALSTSTGKQGIIRRLSRGAASKFSRRRTEESERSMPVLRRRESNGTQDQPSLYTTIAATENAIEDEDAGTVPQRLTLLSPTISQALQQGTKLTRITRKKKETKTFKLDLERAIVSWEPWKPTSRLFIDDIKEIRQGRDARNYREELMISADAEDRWITIIYAEHEENGKLKALHLCAPSKELFTMWVSALEKISKYRYEMMAGLAIQGEKFVNAHWQEAVHKYLKSSPPASMTEGTLPFDDVEKLCRNLQVNCSRRYLRERFQLADSNKSGKLSFKEFQTFVKLLKDREEIRELWKSLVANTELGMTETEFFKFNQDIQKVDTERDHAQVQKVFAKFARKSDREREQQLTSKTAADIQSSQDGNPEGETKDTQKSRKPSAHGALEKVEKRLSAVDFTPETLVRKVEEAFDSAGGIVSERDGMNPGARISMDSFADFLSSAVLNPVLLPTPAGSLDRPLNEYFISTSHNTYLMGRQVAGESSIEGYIRVLQRGCRCVEIDCWDGDDGRPVVNHGRTFTSKVLFVDVIRAISKYAFLVSPYPLIVSLEVHCGKEQQKILADILKYELGERLVVTPFITNSLILPSPQELKHRILIKVKGSEEREDSMEVSNPSRTYSSATAGRQHGSNISTSPPVTSPWAHNSASNSSATEESDDRASGASDSGDSTARRKQKATKIVRALGDLGVYCRGQKYKNFALPESKVYNHVFSFAERTFIGVCKDPEKKAQLEKHNARYLMRIYPSGFRITSSNFDPNIFWRRGAQMVALNWQKFDQGVQMNEAMFATNEGTQGYVLKPKELRQSQHMLNYADESSNLHTKKGKKKVQFAVDVISAQQLPRPRDRESIDPYVEFEVFIADDKARGVATGTGGLNTGSTTGSSGIGASLKRRTQVFRDNGFNPVWNEKFTFTVETKFEALIFVRWSVYNQDGGDKGSLVALYCGKLGALQQGYRHLPLFDAQGEQFLFSTLFVKIKVEPVVFLDGPETRTTPFDSVKNLGRSLLARAPSRRGARSPAAKHSVISP